jgi:hypothetical protein
MIKEYVNLLFMYFNDVRVKKIKELATLIITKGNLWVYNMSENKAQYDVFKGLLNGSQVHTFTSESILEVIRSQAQEPRVLGVHLY